MTARRCLDALRRRPRRDQRGMTLIETMLAVFLSTLMVLPMLGWATLAIKEQAEVEQRNVTAASLGLLRTYFVRDVTNAAAASVEDESLLSCGSDLKVERALLGVSTAGLTVTYAVVADDDGTSDLWRLECTPGTTGSRDRVELLGDLNDAGTSARCESLETLTKADESAGVASSRGKGSGKVDPSKTKDGNPDDNDNGKGNDKQKEPTTTTVDTGACRRVTLQVTTVDLRQAALTATVRSGISSSGVDVAPPSAVVSASPTSGPRRLTVQFVGKESSDPIGQRLSHRWDFGDGTTSTEVNPVKAYTAVGTFTATLTVTNESGLSSSASLTIRVDDNAPAAVIASPANATTVFRGQEVAFSSAGSNDDADKEFGGTLVGYAWDFGDGTTSTEANPTKSYSALSPAGGYTVKLAVFDDAGQTATAEIQLVVANREPSVEIVASTTEGSAPLTVDFSSVVTDETTLSPNPPVTYAWNFGDGGTSTLADPPARTYSTAGTRTVTLTITDDQGATASASRTITVNAALLPAPTNLRKLSSSTSGGTRRIDLGFNAVSGRSLYEVRITCVTSGCSTVASNTGTGTTIRISGLVNANRSWDAEVRTRNSTGQWGPWSSKVRVTT
jgi:PKD repeat protein/Tfp pilus assembly protein PilV